MPNVITLPQFKRLVRGKKSIPRDCVVRKQIVSAFEMMEDRLVRFTISTPAVDREMDTISVDGWELGTYRNNPVVLWGHNCQEFPVGRATEIGPVGGVLKATAEFVPGDIPCAGERAECVLRLLRGVFLSAVSVGFRPLEYHITEDPERGAEDWFPGLDFIAQELLEFSVVTIPANPEALIDPGQQMISEEDGQPSETLSPRGDGLENDNLMAGSPAQLAKRLRRAIARHTSR